MGSPAELSLECRPSASAYSSVLKAISLVGDQLERMRRLDEYLKGLEEERRKIEAFKRELPFCMHLLNDAIAASKEHLADCQRPSVQGTRAIQMGLSYDQEQYLPTARDRPVLEEFIPIKKSCEEESAAESEQENQRESKRTRFGKGEKPNWMSSAQLWSQNSEAVDCTKERTSMPEESLKQPDSHVRSNQEHVFPGNSKLFSDSKQRIGGAFLPFSRDRQVNPPLPAKSNAEKALPDLALSSGEQEVVGSLFRCNDPANLNNNGTTTSRSRSKETTETAALVPTKGSSARPNGGVTTPAPATPNATQSSGQSQRKARRCWSPELHRRFVNALQQLGGSQATPKQIRELMKVDGLTNDEVKSHLQKYRLHTRRPSPTPQTSASQTPQLVVLGGIWVPPEYAAHAAAAAHQAPGLYSPLSTTTTSHSQSHYCQSSIPQEYFSQMNSTSQLQLPRSAYCDQQQTPSNSLSSPQGPLQFTGQSSGARGISGDGGREESVGEDGKSESSSWKGEENTENIEVGDMGRVLSLRKQSVQFMDGDDGDREDSRGSETRLKF